MRPTSAIESLRVQVRQIEGRRRRATTVLPFEIAAVDSRLPGGGLLVGALHEVAGGGNGAIDGAAAALFTAGIAAELSPKVGEGVNRGRRHIVGVFEPPLLHRRSDMPCPTITLSN